jgi:excisionase family DNA binding protein
MAQLDELVTSAEAAELLAVDRSVIVRYVQSGKLVPARKLPGRTGSYLFARSDIDALPVREAS